MMRDRTLGQRSATVGERTAMLSKTTRGSESERGSDEDTRTDRGADVFREAALLLAALAFLAAAAIAAGWSLVLVWFAGLVVLQGLVLLNVARNGAFERLVGLTEGVLLSLMGSVYLLAYSWRIWQGFFPRSDFIPALVIAGLTLVAGVCRISHSRKAR